MKPALLTCIAVAASLAFAEEPEAPLDGSPTEGAIAKWQDLRFGMFIHWGPVSLRGTEIGWSRGNQIPIEEYDKLYKQFNPENFDAVEWAKTAKKAGMKYLVLTTKHHDGFCLWDSAVTDYDIMASPFGRDVVKELADACRAEDIKFGTYYSTCDWYHPDFPLGSPAGRTKKPNPNLTGYDQYLRAQTRELVTKYGPLLTIWFDVPQAYNAEFGVPMVQDLRKLQPDLLINNRAFSVPGRNHHNSKVGDYFTPEQKIGEYNDAYPWETCMTIARQWAWKPNDSMKSLDQCIRTLINTNGRGGNLLFNVGPMPDGRIEPRQVARLEEMGEWLEKNGESIYGTRGGPIMPGKGIVTTRKDNTIYVHVLKEAPDPIELPAFDRKITAARILGGSEIKITQCDTSWSFHLPQGSRKPIDTVISITLDESAMDLKATEMPSMFKSAKASNTYKNQPEYEAAMAIDGNPGTRWASETGKAPYWFEADFSSPTILRGFEVIEAEPYQGRVQQFVINLKIHNEWKPVASGTSLNQFRKQLEPVEATAIRIEIQKASEGPTLSEINLIK